MRYINYPLYAGRKGAQYKVYGTLFIHWCLAVTTDSHNSAPAEMATSLGANRVRSANLAIRAAIACLTDAELSHTPHHSVRNSRTTRH